MSFINSLNISASGMSAQKLRLDVAAENIANQETTRTENGGTLQKKNGSAPGGGGQQLPQSHGFCFFTGQARRCQGGTDR